jgi:hypothetical protein
LYLLAALSAGFFGALPGVSGAAAVAALGLYKVMSRSLDLRISRGKTVGNVILFLLFLVLAGVGSVIGSALFPLLAEFKVTVQMAVAGLIIGGAPLYFRRAYLPVKPAFTAARENKKRKKSAAQQERENALAAAMSATVDENSNIVETVAPIAHDTATEQANASKRGSMLKSKLKAANQVLASEMSLKPDGDDPLPDMSKAIYGLFLAILCAVVGIVVALNAGNTTEDIEITRSLSGENSTIVRITNNSNFEISAWRIEFKGSVQSANTDIIAYEDLFAKMARFFSNAAAPDDNAFVSNDANGKIPPGGNVTFNYTSPLRSRLPIEISATYDANANLMMILALAAFVAGLTFTFPSVSIFMVFSLFGVGATVESAIGEISIGLLAVIGIFALLGLYAGGKLWGKAFRKSDVILDDFKQFYADCAFTGFLVAAAFSALPDVITMDLYMILGFVAFGSLGAITVAVGAEIVSNEELELTDEKLLAK